MTENICRDCNAGSEAVEQTGAWIDMQSPRISIIVPVYNVEEYLPQCLNSLVNQTFREIEIICVNDGSTDGSLKILENYSAKDGRVKVLSQENKGLSEARNSGLSHISGEYVIFVDGDDWIDNDTCEKAYEKAKEYGVDVVLWAYTREFENTSKEKRLYEGGSYYFNETEAKDKVFRRCIGLCGEELAHPEQADTVVTVWGKLYRASIINDVRFVDTKEIEKEDALFNIQALWNIHGAYYIDECKNHYRKTNISSFTHGYKPDIDVQWESMYRCISNFIDEKHLPDVCKAALSNRRALGILGLGLNYIGGGHTRHFASFPKSCVQRNTARHIRSWITGISCRIGSFFINVRNTV